MSTTIVRTGPGVAIAQNIGTRSEQCDAAAFRNNRDGVRALVVLDGIGSSPEIRDWTRSAAQRLAIVAARVGDAETALQAEYTRYATERADIPFWEEPPSAAAIVAVIRPGQPITIAWAGDCRAYAINPGEAQRLTADHNLRRVYPPCETHNGGNRNVITSYLGDVTADAIEDRYNHPAIEATTYTPTTSGTRLLLATDGAYEPHETTTYPLTLLAEGPMRIAAANGVQDAVTTAEAATEPDVHADNATILLARA
ncbi:protein phosphatase 2C domain-containing protein [Streptomyces xiamenensis]|uniref:protein phosphatase 2C domain-containing protein n=1 Tax=Streptomyces xiamenensis TaxID=408015 RepID=UPI003D7404FA